MKTLIKDGARWHFVRVCTVCFDKSKFSLKERHHNLEISTIHPLEYKMNNSILIVLIYLGRTIKMKKVNSSPPWEIFPAFLSSADFFSKSTFPKKLFQEYKQSVK